MGGGEERVMLTSASKSVLCSLGISTTGDGSIEVAGRKDGGNPARYLGLYGCRRKIGLECASRDIISYNQGRKMLRR
jgi:hypothetical protein